MSTKDFVEKDFYKVLGVPKDATEAEIKKAYRKLAREFHPDANKGNAKAEERFKEISEANDVLGDPKKRKEYDEARALFGNGGFRPGPGAGGSFNFDLGDLFEAAPRAAVPRAASAAASATSSAACSTVAAPARPAPSPGAARTSTPRSPSASPRRSRVRRSRCGCPRKLPARRVRARATRTAPRVCPTCVGTGQVARGSGGGFSLTDPCPDCKGRGLIAEHPCLDCKGSGRAKSSRTMQVRIPAGVTDSQRIRLRGKGAPGERGGPSGDLYVVVHVGAHPVFGRKDDNLTVTVPVTFTEAALGGEVKVPTLGGPSLTLKLPPGTPNGRTMRARGKGAVRKDGTRGDLLVTVEVSVPKDLSGKARDALEAYREATAGEDPRAELFEAAKGA